MPTPLFELIKGFLNAVENKDINKAINYFDNDAEVIDPHYPVAHMHGKDAILEGLSWSFKQLKKLGFTIVNYFESDDKTNAAVEIRSNHELTNGKKINTPQVFVFEFHNEQITRLQAYQPYSPDGIPGFILKIIRLTRTLTGRKSSHTKT